MLIVEGWVKCNRGRGAGAWPGLIKKTGEGSGIEMFLFFFLQTRTAGFVRLAPKLALVTAAGSAGLGRCRGPGLALRASKENRNQKSGCVSILIRQI